MPVETATISLAEAQRVLAAASAHAAEIGVAAGMVIVDGSGRLVAAARMDDAKLMAMDIATGKAYTAAGQNQATELWDQVTADAPGFGGAITSIPGFTPFGGGKPLQYDGRLIGAIGVSGGAVEQDIAIAQAGADSL
jgi:glc operon protein GlcG